MNIPTTGTPVRYVNPEGRVYEARVLAIVAELEVFGGEHGNWTVIHVPYGADAPGAHWLEAEPAASAAEPAQAARPKRSKKE